MSVETILRLHENFLKYLFQILKILNTKNITEQCFWCHLAERFLSIDTFPIDHFSYVIIEHVSQDVPCSMFRVMAPDCCQGGNLKLNKEKSVLKLNLNRLYRNIQICFIQLGAYDTHDSVQCTDLIEFWSYSIWALDSLVYFIAFKNGTIVNTVDM